MKLEGGGSTYAGVVMYLHALMHVYIHVGVILSFAPLGDGMSRGPAGTYAEW